MSAIDKAETKRALITGGTGAIGQAIVEGLLCRGIDVTVLVRNTEKGERVKDAILSAVGSAPRIELCDLSCKDDIFAAAKHLCGPFHILINNAAECPRRKQQTAEGIERQFASNVLGYYWMMTAFLPHLEHGAPSRIVNVSSYWAGGLDFGDLEFRQRTYDNDAAYRQSKQADRMLTAAFAARLQDKQITVNTCHPGDVRSKLSSDLGFLGHETAKQGAATPLMLALDDIGIQVTGRYFAHLREERCQFVEDPAAVERLFDICSRY